MSRAPYTYSILRYRHDPLSGEQVNIAVALHSGATRFVGFRIKKAYSRLKQLFPDLDTSILRNDLARIERAFAIAARAESEPQLFDAGTDVMAFARRVVSIDDGAMIWSVVGTGVTTDPEKTLESIYWRFVGQYDKPEMHKRPDADVWRPFRDKLVEKNIAHLFDKKVISSSRVEVEFEHAWKNGVWHCFQPLSFDLATSDGIQDKAARWVGQMVGLSKSAEQFRTYFIVGEPTEQAMFPAYHRAIDFLKDATGADVVLEKDVDILADQIEDKVHHSHSVG